MIFHDRMDAGRQLAQALERYRGAQDVIVLGLPRGGVVVAAEVARALHVPLDIVVPRKIGAPGNEEFAIGALTEEGNPVWNKEARSMYDIPQHYIDTVVGREKKEAERRLKTYRGNRSPLDFHGKAIILIDDGVATGLTMEAAIVSIRAKGAAKVVVAVPVAAKDSLMRIRRLVDNVICLYVPDSFGAVGEFYDEFDQTTDAEVIQILVSL